MPATFSATCVGGGVPEEACCCGELESAPGASADGGKTPGTELRLGRGTVLLIRAGLMGTWPGIGDEKLGIGAGAEMPAGRVLVPANRRAEC